MTREPQTPGAAPIRGLQVRMLGRPRLELDGQPLTPLMAVKHQALVLHLAADEHPIRRSRLAALLWGRLEPAAARANLRVALSRLRRQMPGVLAIDAEEVGFERTAPIRVDWRELEQIAAAPEAASHEAAVAAVRAWRGPLLDGFELDDAEEFDHWMGASRQRAARSAAGLRRWLAGTCEAAGRTDEAVEHLRGWLEIDDSDEQAHMDLMRLLAAGGRRTAAIAQYEVCRATLLDRLGARPSADCYALYRHIHADAPQPDASHPPDAADRPSTTYAGAALPAAGAGLVGRQAELALVGERLLDPLCRWLSIVGPGGVGKTRLAAAAAERIGRHFGGGVLWTSGREWAGERGPEQIRRRAEDLAREIGGRRGSPPAVRTLLVLDNLETLENARETVGELLAKLPLASVLATSRVRLGGTREWLLELGGLSLDRDATGAAASSEAAQMFVACMRRFDTGFELHEHGAAIERLVARISGLPLALELAAQGARVVGVSEMAARVESGAALVDPDREPDDPHRSLDAVLQDSWSALPEFARAGARRLATLPEEFDADLARMVQVHFDALETMRRHSWLSNAGGGRLAMHPLQRAFVRRSADDPALAQDVAARVAAQLRGRLVAVGIFGDLAGPDGGTPPATAAEPLRTVQRRDPPPALFDPAVVTLAAEHVIAHWPLPAMADFVDDAAAWLVAGDRGREAVELLARASRRDDLPGWRRSGWHLRQAEVLNDHGHAVVAARIWRHSLERFGFGDIESQAPLTRWPGLLRRAANPGHLPASDAERHAFTGLVARSLMSFGRHLSFIGRPGPMFTCAALLWLLGWRTGRPAERFLADAVAAYGSLLVGHPRLSRRIERRCRDRLAGRLDDRHIRLAAEDAIGARRVADGQWDGLEFQLDALAAGWRELHCARYELDARSLAAKLAFYQGRLRQSGERFAALTARARLLDVATGLFLGPMGEVEVGLALGTQEPASLLRLLEDSRQIMSEIENVDAAYTLRWFGLRARIAWRQGDVEALREAVMAGAAACQRIRFCGFWAHEGFAGIGEGLLRLRRHERGTGGAVDPLLASWAAFRRPLRAHCRRFTPGRILWYYLAGLHAAEAGRLAEADRALRASVRHARSQGMRFELARSCAALGGIGNDADATAHAAHLWRDMGSAGEVPAFGTKVRGILPVLHA